MSKDDSRNSELTATLQHLEKKLAERDAMISTVIGQTETARAQYEQANERAETLRRRIDAKDEQLSNLQKQIDEAQTEIATLRSTLAKRDERIALLEKLHTESDNALMAIHQDAKRQQATVSNEHVAAMGLVLESLDEAGTEHRITRATTTLGRSAANDIPINSTSASRFHARIVVEADKVYLVDLKSTNGCTVNGRRAARQQLSDRAIVAIGDAKFRFIVGAGIKDQDDSPMTETRVITDDPELLGLSPGSRASATQEKA